MSKIEKVEFNPCVVCEYVRQWDTHRINEEVGRLTDATLKEIEEADKSIEFGLSGEFASSFRFDHYTEESAPAWLHESIKSQGKVSSLDIFKRGFLVLSANLEICEAQYRNALRNADGSQVEDGKYSDDVLIDVYKDFVTSTLSNYAFLFSLAASIAKPGAFQFVSRHLVHDRRIVRTDSGTLNSFENSFEISSKFSWPPIALLNVFDVWDWLVRLPGFTNGESQNSLGRAVGALSYLVNGDSKDQNELALVWTLVGLEALYGKGNTGLKSQLMEKSESFLGKRVSHKKEFGNMYDFRSRLVHGDKNFHFNGFEGVLEEYSFRLWESEDFAVATLLSTLQKMCQYQMTELSFRIVVDSGA